MWNAILVEKIIELMSITFIAASQDTHSGEYTIAAKPSSSHNQCIDDGFAHRGNFREGVSKFGRRDVEDFGFFRCNSARTEDRRALQHRYVPDEIALMRRGEVIFGTIAR